MQAVFGPVPSRRLGRSLGIDPVPLKTCNWNCVYCQLGATSSFELERKEYVSSDLILSQLEDALEAHKEGGIDWITFVGSGETCLNNQLGNMIAAVKQRTSLPIAVITNGSLLYDPQVRSELSLADAVMPSLDAADDHLYRRINRAHPSLTLDSLVNGIKAFRHEYSGNLWIEVMLVSGLNDDPKALGALAKLMDEICPDEIHFLLPTRPPVENWVNPPKREEILRALLILGNRAKLFETSEGDFELNSSETVAEALVSILTRHPMLEEDALEAIEKRLPGEGEKTLRELIAAGRVSTVNRQGKHFYSASGSKYHR